MRKRKNLIVILMVLSVSLAGCNSKTSNSVSGSSSANTSEVSTMDTSDMFSDRDMKTGYDEATSAAITLSDNGSSSDSSAVQIEENTITITDEGTYILSGTLTDGMVIVEAEDTDKVQLVLKGADITNADSAAIYVRSADKVFVTTAEGSENVLTNGGSYTAIDENNIDAVIFSKSDLTLNGEGTLKITAKEGHGVVSKDDLVLTSGTYEIEAASHGLSGKDSVRIGGGTYDITAGKDGIHGSNTDDTSLGYVYIKDGTIHIQAEDDGIHADSALLIEGGTVEIAESYEGLEGLSIDISGGEITVESSDDGLNAAGGNDSSGVGGQGGDQFAAEEGAYIHISGGTLHVNASGDGIDSNGDVEISGGETYVSGPTNNGNGIMDYAGEATITGGVFVGAGSSGMAQNFGENSTQGSMMVTVDTQSAGTELSLTDADGNELVSWEPDKEYSCVILSTPDITKGESYTVTAGESTQEINMDSLIYGSSGTQGGPGGGNPGGNAPGKTEAGGNAPEGGNGEKNQKPGNGQDMGTPPDRQQ